MLELHGWGDLQTELNTLSKRGPWDEMADLIDDEMLDTFAVVGELDDIAGQGARAVRGAWSTASTSTPPTPWSPSAGPRCWPASTDRRAAPAGQTTMLTSLGGRTMTRRGAAPSQRLDHRRGGQGQRLGLLLGDAGATSIRSRTLPLTWTTMVTESSAASAGSATGQGLEVDVVAVPALPGLGGQVGRHRGQQQQQGVDGLIDDLGVRRRSRT